VAIAAASKKSYDGLQKLLTANMMPALVQVASCMRMAPEMVENGLVSEMWTGLLCKAPPAHVPCVPCR
jgi:hypothetical protein